MKFVRYLWNDVMKNQSHHYYTYVKKIEKIKMKLNVTISKSFEADFLQWGYPH